MLNNYRAEFLLISIFTYLQLFGLVILPLIYFGAKAVIKRKDIFGILVGVFALFSPLFGFLVFQLAGYLEENNLSLLWWMLMFAVMGLPLLLAIKVSKNKPVVNNSISQKRTFKNSIFPILSLISAVLITILILQSQGFLAIAIFLPLAIFFMIGYAYGYVRIKLNSSYNIKFYNFYYTRIISADEHVHRFSIYNLCFWFVPLVGVCILGNSLACLKSYPTAAIKYKLDRNMRINLSLLLLSTYLLTRVL